MILLLLALQQQAKPATVGDTLWATRAVRLAPGDNVRPAPWELDGPVQILGRPVVVTQGDQVQVRYPLVAWEAGDHVLDVPGPIITHGSGVEDTLPSQSMTFIVHSVLPAGVPDSELAVQPPANPVLRRFVSPLPAIALGSLAALLLVPLFWWWQRRGKPTAPVRSVAPEGPSEDLVRRWAESGERRVVASVAATILRRAIAQADRSAHEGLDTVAVLGQVRDRHPEWPQADIAQVLAELDRIRFAPGQQENVFELYQRSVAIAHSLAGPAA